MLKKLLSLPLRAAKVAIRFARGSKEPRSDGPLAYTPASGGLKRPSEAVQGARPSPTRPSPPPADDRDHGHDHGHGHGHDHGHDQPVVAPEEAASPSPAPAARGRGAKKPPATPKVEVHAEQTPNPNARKFTVVGRPVLEKGSISFNSATEAQGDALGEALFAVPGVRSVFAVKDFVTVTKEEGADWARLEAEVTKALRAMP